MRPAVRIIFAPIMSRTKHDRERGMFPFIREQKSLRKAIELFGRI